MKAYIQNLIGATPDQYQKYSVLYYMSGAVPQTIDDVKAAVDLSDMSDLHAKCVGTTMITATVGSTSASGGQKNITFYNGNSNTLTCLKGGAFATTSGTQYYIPMPSRVYYTNGRKSTLASMPPSLFANPYYPITATSSNANGVKYRDNATFGYSWKAAGSEIYYTVEYDQATTISALRFCNGYYDVSGYHVYSAALDYWNGTAWVNLISGAAYNTPIQTAATLTCTATTATKFRITLYPSAETAGYNMLCYCGISLMHTEQPNAVAVPDITWGIIVPTYTFTQNISNFGDVYITNMKDYTYDNNWSNFNASTYDVTKGLPVGRNSNWYGVITTNIPAIIDTCGQDSTVNKIAISKSTGLMSTDKPMLASYKYYLGDLL